MQKLNWGILGTGAIAHAFAKGLKQSVTGKLVAVGSRNKKSAQVFASEFGATASHGSYESLFADSDVQAVYISAPHPFHAEWTIKAIEAGKHVLCEKPLAMNQWQAQVMVEAARKKGVYLSEAFMYRFHPQTQKLVELIKEGAIGEVRMIQAAFGFNAGDDIDPDHRLVSNALGGGGILDVGCYAASAARLVAGAAIGKDFDNPVEVSGSGKVGTTGVDEWTAAVLKFKSGVVAQVSTAIKVGLDNSLVVRGTEGQIIVPNPWLANRQEASIGKILLTRDGKTDEIEIPANITSFAIEADGVAKAVQAGKQEPAAPAMTWEDTLGNMAVLDAWRKAVGVVYDEEKPAKRQWDLTRRPVNAKSPGTTQMTFGQLPGLDKPVSKMIFGALTAHGSFAKAQVLFDNWLAVGGNAFDTSYHYGRGSVDKVLGDWIKSRGVREEVVILAKGAHTPFCDPENLTEQLMRSLDCFQSNYADIYIMHRDNPDIPVGEFIDVLNEHLAAGRIKVFGGSNWSPERFAEANAYAKKHGKQGMSILNNNLSLARMEDPVWGGCIHMSDTGSRQWMAENKVIHMAWSSQARGFFTERTQWELESPGYDEELRRCWISEDNLARRDRAMKLAREKGVLPINIAAAYVLSQAFESYALIGPETIHEMETTLPALDIELSPAEIEWLWQG